MHQYQFSIPGKHRPFFHRISLFYKVVLPKNNVAITRLPSAEYAPEQA
ncbi:hypothetical protein CSC16_2463 [Proteus mirabilis]|nr:hypothetical protein CSC16_2463 [Proteus mirabilis]